MFTGLVQATGQLQRRSGGLTLQIPPGSDLDPAQLALGDSVAVDGVCLTVTERSASCFQADVSEETLSRTTLSAKADRGGWVNLEPALRLQDRLGGHLVSGHVDGVGQIERIVEDARFWRVTIAAPENLARYIAMKGSICVDGTSLTVNQVEGANFELTIIPQTWEETVFSEYQTGSPVNLEVDVIARYLERLMQYDQSTSES